MTLVTEAVIFAAQAHDGAARKGSVIPYIVHPMEVVAICGAGLSGEPAVQRRSLSDVEQAQARHCSAHLRRMPRDENHCAGG